MADNYLRAEVVIDRVEHTLDRIAREAFSNSNAIIPLNEGYRAFGRYLLIKQNSHYDVFRGATLAAQPSNGKIALAWCIADKLGKFSLTQELTLFDQEIERRRDELRYFRNMLSVTQDLDRRLIIEDRLQHSQIRLRWLQQQLDKCVNLAKYWQLKGFKDETARIGLKNQNTTNT